MTQKIRPFMLPFAMLTGGIFYEFFSRISFLSPWVIFLILFLTYCRFAIKEFKFTRLHWGLILFQIITSALLYVGLSVWDQTLAQGVMICVLVPTAMSAPVVTGLLGGSVVFVAAYTLIGNTVMAVVSPFLFSLIGTHGDLSVGEAFIQICYKVVPLLVFPLLLALFVGKFLPTVNAQIKKYPTISFYLWNVGLMLVTGKTVYFLVTHSRGNYAEVILIALVVLAVCIMQFAVGKRLGDKYGERIAAGQSLGQKNTILAIWMAQTYLNPLASIGPASYVLWQNIINSYQMWKKERASTKTVSIK
ncbi:MAG: hypothetical protein ACRDDZ_01695 [Marinifilaceae bacterium]